MAIKEYRDSRTDRDPRRDPSDPPPKPPSIPPTHLDGVLERFGKRWGTIVAIIVGASTLINFGVKVAETNTNYATVAATNKLSKSIDELTAQVSALGDVRALAQQATKNALAAQDRVAEIDHTVDRIVGAIEGFNAVSTRHGRPSPLPLQAK